MKNVEKGHTRYFPGDLETPGKTGRVGRYVLHWGKVLSEIHEQALNYLHKCWM